MAPDATFPVLVHPYNSHVAGACAYERGNIASKNALVFIGGLSDGPHTVGFVGPVAKRLEDRPELGFSVFEVRLRSSFIGFGTSSLVKDVEDISAFVKYLRSIGREKIILFGHSTGCQDCMEYTKYADHSNEPVDGFILQGPISDRDGVEDFVPDYRTMLEYAEKMIAEGKEKDCAPRDKTPKVYGAPMTAYRMRSLLAKGGDDDYFSADLDDGTVSKVWARFQVPVMILHSEKDEYVPATVDQQVLNDRYRNKNPNISKLSGLIPGAGHAVPQPEAREWLAERVASFLDNLLNGKVDRGGAMR